MKILAVDTSSKICAVALLEDEKVIDEIILDNGKTHSENLMPIIKEILERNNLKLNEINLISISVGPGSFTGIRIGIASLKPIAEFYSIPVSSVTSLESLAQNAKNNTDSVIVSLIDAKNDQVYAGFFNQEIDFEEDEVADDINNVLSKFDKFSKIICVGDGAEKHKELIEKYCIDKGIELEFSNNNDQSASSTGKVGFKKYTNNDLKNADTILPIYLRKSQAERLKKD